MVCDNPPCTNEGVLTCSRCHFAKYCSVACQKQENRYHKVRCEKIEITNVITANLLQLKTHRVPTNTDITGLDVVRLGEVFTDDGAYYVSHKNPLETLEYLETLDLNMTSMMAAQLVEIVSFALSMPSEPTGFTMLLSPKPKDLSGHMAILRQDKKTREYITNIEKKHPSFEKDFSEVLLFELPDGHHAGMVRDGRIMSMSWFEWSKYLVRSMRKDLNAFGDIDPNVELAKLALDASDENGYTGMDAIQCGEDKK